MTGHETRTKMELDKMLKMDSNIDRNGSVSKNNINTECNSGATEIIKDCQKTVLNDNTDDKMKEEIHSASYSTLDCSGSPFKLVSENDKIQDIQSERHLSNFWNKHEINNVKIGHALLVACSLTAATICIWYLLHL